MILYLKLFLSFLQIGLFSIGGGYAAMPVIENQVVTLNGWLTENQFDDLVIIAEMTPGPIAVNSSTFVGMQIAGLPGALIATLGCILPSFIIVSLLANLYLKYREIPVLKTILSILRPAVVALIASAGLSILIRALWNGGSAHFSMKHIDFIAVTLFAVCMIILRYKKINPIFVMLGAGIIGGTVHYFSSFCFISS